MPRETFLQSLLFPPFIGKEPGGNSNVTGPEDYLLLGLCEAEGPSYGSPVAQPVCVFLKDAHGVLPQGLLLGGAELSIPALLPPTAVEANRSCGCSAPHKNQAPVGFGGINERETGLNEQDKFAGKLLVAVKAKPEAFTYPLEGDFKPGLWPALKSLVSRGHLTVSGRRCAGGQLPFVSILLMAL